MANTDRPNGFFPVGHLSTGQYNGATRRYHVADTYGTALFPGDLVVLSGTAEAVTGIPGIEAAAAGDEILGVLISVDPRAPGLDGNTSASLEQKHLPASTGGYVNVCDDPLVILEAQEDSVAEEIVVTEVGLLFDHIAGAGDATRGSSGHEIDSSASTGATFRLLGLVQREDNEISTNARWLVTINDHHFATGGAAV